MPQTCCPVCQKTMLVGNEVVGKLVGCPRCGHAYQAREVKDDSLGVAAILVLVTAAFAAAVWWWYTH